jgi:short-subunit dehydrogenase
MHKAVLITGCSSGIGLTAALDLQQRGYRVIAACRKPQDLAALEQKGFETIQLDLDDPRSVELAAARVIEITNGRLYGLFNNAGFGVYGALSTINRRQMEQQFSTNFFGLHQLTMLLLPAMLPHNEGRIIQTSSIMGFISTPGRGAYAASKYAVEAWSDALRLELYNSGIKVSLIEPGPIKTAFTQNVNQTRTDRPVKNPGIAKRFTLTAEAILPKLHHALESPRPKVRYRITLVTQVTAILKRLLPDPIMDVILKNK